MGVKLFFYSYNPIIQRLEYQLVCSDKPTVGSAK